MKRFRFSLHSVLTLRDIQEQKAREAFARALHAHALAAAALESARARVAASARALCEVRERVFRPGEHAAALLSWRGDCATEKRAAETLRLAGEAMNKARAAWLDARRHLQAIENLKVRARQRHRQTGEREEQTALDEFASMRVARAVGAASATRPSSRPSRDSRARPSFS
ncbi:flagellar biogenesis protein [Opitutaceae bacterium TAV4]|nr:flagellar biogenesis protein [Opitutaceae bacterium TAV4]RRK02566.1 flagellar biogenesis protein [Opitutaceae bacterium TAV3]